MINSEASLPSSVKLHAHRLLQDAGASAVSRRKHSCGRGKLEDLIADQPVWAPRKVYIYPTVFPTWKYRRKSFSVITRFELIGQREGVHQPIQNMPALGTVWQGRELEDALERAFPTDLSQGIDTSNRRDAHALQCSSNRWPAFGVWTWTSTVSYEAYAPGRGPLLFPPLFHARMSGCCCCCVEAGLFSTKIPVQWTPVVVHELQVSPYKGRPLCRVLFNYVAFRVRTVSTALASSV